MLPELVLRSDPERVLAVSRRNPDRVKPSTPYCRATAAPPRQPRAKIHRLSGIEPAPVPIPPGGVPLERDAHGGQLTRIGRRPTNPDPATFTAGAPAAAAVDPSSARGGDLDRWRLAVDCPRVGHARNRSCDAVLRLHGERVLARREAAIRRRRRARLVARPVKRANERDTDVRIEEREPRHRRARRVGRLRGQRCPSTRMRGIDRDTEQRGDSHNHDGPSLC